MQARRYALGAGGIGLCAVVWLLTSLVDGPQAFSGPQPGPRVPAGTIAAFGGTDAPNRWLLCDGSEVSRTMFAGLFSVIGTTYGEGNGMDTFNLPDLRQRFPLGLAAAGTGSMLGDTGGVIDHVHGAGSYVGSEHTHEAGSLIGPAHTHEAGSYTASDHSHSLSGNTGSDTSGDYRAWDAPPGSSRNPIDASRGTHTHVLPATTISGGGAITGTSAPSGDGPVTGTSGVGGGPVAGTSAPENPPFLVVNYIIKV